MWRSRGERNGREEERVHHPTNGKSRSYTLHRERFKKWDGTVVDKTKSSAWTELGRGNDVRRKKANRGEGQTRVHPTVHQTSQTRFASYHAAPRLLKCHLARSLLATIISSQTKDGANSQNRLLLAIKEHLTPLEFRPTRPAPGSPSTAFRMGASIRRDIPLESPLQPCTSNHARVCVQIGRMLP